VRKRVRKRGGKRYGAQAEINEEPYDMPRQRAERCAQCMICFNHSAVRRALPMMMSLIREVRCKRCVEAARRRATQAPRARARYDARRCSGGGRRVYAA